MMLRTTFLSAALVAVASLSSAHAHAAGSLTASHTASLEERVLAELNRLRANPQAYAHELEALRSHYRGKLFMRDDGPPIRTEEGVAALDEAIADVARAAPARPMSTSMGLALAAHDQVADEGVTGAVGHRGSDGSNSLDRISRHGKSAGRSGEVIDYGWDDAKNIVVDLLIDDGIKNRGHRNAILRDEYAQAGVSCGPHAKYGVMCVVEMAQHFTDMTSAVASR